MFGKVRINVCLFLMFLVHEKRDFSQFSCSYREHNHKMKFSTSESSNI